MTSGKNSKGSGRGEAQQTGCTVRRETGGREETGTGQYGSGVRRPGENV